MGWDFRMAGLFYGGPKGGPHPRLEKLALHPGVLVPVVVAWPCDTLGERVHLHSGRANEVPTVPPGCVCGSGRGGVTQIPREPCPPPSVLELCIKRFG